MCISGIHSASPFGNTQPSSGGSKLKPASCHVAMTLSMRLAHMRPISYQLFFLGAEGIEGPGAWDSIPQVSIEVAS